jgi:hypothetical protein
LGFELFGESGGEISDPRSLSNSLIKRFSLSREKSADLQSSIILRSLSNALAATPGIFAAICFGTERTQ